VKPASARLARRRRRRELPPRRALLIAVVGSIVTAVTVAERAELEPNRRVVVRGDELEAEREAGPTVRA
jgi:hypothetical protein